MLSDLKHNAIRSGSLHEAWLKMFKRIRLYKKIKGTDVCINSWALSQKCLVIVYVIVISVDLHHCCDLIRNLLGKSELNITN